MLGSKKKGQVTVFKWASGSVENSTLCFLGGGHEASVTLLVVASVVPPFWIYKNKGTVKRNSMSTKLNFCFESLQNFQLVTHLNNSK